MTNYKNQIADELGIPFSIGMSIFFIICKFTYLPHLSWLFCLFPIWLPILLVLIICIGMLVWSIIEEIIY
jgi:hypothetical protein